jgi:GDP-4-dehydro-6-deoxy-D-mannose reductase
MKKIKINRNFKKCLITGITGSGGSYLAEHINEKASKIGIYGTSRKPLNTINKNLRKIANIYKLNLLHYKKTKAYLKRIKPDLIFHIASYADVRKSFYSPIPVINNNNTITLNILEAIRTLKLNPLIILCSSSEVYGNVKKKQQPITENQLMRPISPYAVSKSFQDLLSQVYCTSYKLKIIITRMFSYTNGRRYNLFQSSFAKQIVEIENNKRKYLLHGNLNSFRSILDIEDAMEAYWQTAKKGKIGEIYNIGANQSISVKKVLRTLISFSKKKITAKKNKNLLRVKDIYIQMPSSSKFRKHTGWRPKVKIKDSLKKLLDDERKKVIKLK